MHTSTVHQLELRWQESKNEIEQVFMSEDVRRKQVRVCKLENTTDRLIFHASAKDRDALHLKLTSRSLQTKLQRALNKIRSLQSDLKSRDGVTYLLQTELAHAQTHHVRNADLNTEKLALAEELTSLRSQLSKLREGQKSHRDTLSAKRALERQLSTVEVELESERRRNQAARDEVEAEKKHDSEVESRLRSALAKLAEESRARREVEQQAKEARALLMSHDRAQDTKLDNLETELQLVRDKLKQSQARLFEVQRQPIISKRTRDIVIQRSKIQSTGEDTGMKSLLDTPTGSVLDAKAKHFSRPGQQSDFHLSPVLPRARDDPLDDQEPSVSGTARKPHLRHLRPLLETLPTQTIITQNHPSQICISNAVADEDDPTNLLREHQQPKTLLVSKSVFPLKRLPDEGSSLNFSAGVSERNGPLTLKPKQKGANITLHDDEPSKKRRKIKGGGGQEMSDDDDDEPGTSLSKAAKQNLRSKPGYKGSLNLIAPSIGRARNLSGHNTFSPLKRDKRRPAV